MHILQTAGELLAHPRGSGEARAAASLLVKLAGHYDSPTPLAQGEAGPCYIGKAVSRIMSARNLREGGTMTRLEAWMQAEVIAVCTASAQERATQQPMTQEGVALLRERFTLFALSNADVVIPPWQPQEAGTTASIADFTPAMALALGYGPDPTVSSVSAGVFRPDVVETRAAGNYL